MDPAFKLLCKGQNICRVYRVSNIVDVKDFAIAIDMGDRKIVFRAATGEQGEKGPFPFVELHEETGVGGFLMTESHFEDIWKFLEAGCR